MKGSDSISDYMHYFGFSFHPTSRFFHVVRYGFVTPVAPVAAYALASSSTISQDKVINNIVATASPPPAPAPVVVNQEEEMAVQQMCQHLQAHGVQAQRSPYQADLFLVRGSEITEYTIC
jgi:hypothetical protein